MEKGLDIILVNVQDDDSLVSAINKANGFFKDLFNGHSEYQIKNFILNDQDFPLPDDKYYQAMTESYVRYEELLNLSFRLRRIDNDIILRQIDLDELSKNNDDENEFNIRRDAVKRSITEDEILQLILEKENIKKRLGSTLREMMVFVEVVDNLKDVKQFKNYEEKERESWNIKTKEFGRSLPTSNLESIEKRLDTNKVDRLKAVK